MAISTLFLLIFLVVGGMILWRNKLRDSGHFYLIVGLAVVLIGFLLIGVWYQNRQMICTETFESPVFRDVQLFLECAK